MDHVSPGRDGVVRQHQVLARTKPQRIDECHCKCKRDDVDMGGGHTSSVWKLPTERPRNLSHVRNMA